jgi:hypothetical protein
MEKKTSMVEDLEKKLANMRKQDPWKKLKKPEERTEEGEKGTEKNCFHFHIFSSR